MSKLSIWRTVARCFRKRLANVVPAIGRDRVDIRRVVMVRKEVSAETRDAKRANHSAVRRAVSVDRLVAMKLREMRNNLHAAIPVEV